MATKKKTKKHVRARGILVKKLEAYRRKAKAAEPAPAETPAAEAPPASPEAVPETAATPVQEAAAEPAPAAAEPRLSGLAAAAQVLAAAAEPLSARAVVDRMLAQGLWSTKGKTPAATIYVAMLREIKAKGEASRFRMPEPGKFAAAAAG